MSIKITNEDNMALMARYPDNHFDLAIVDLEYGIDAGNNFCKHDTVVQKNGNKLRAKMPDYKNKNWDKKISDDAYLTELFRVSKQQIIFGGNYYGLKGGYLVWDKLNGNSDQFGCEMAWISNSKRTDIVYFLWSGMMQGMYVGKEVRRALIQQGNKKLNEKRIHPTQKPVKIYEWLLANYAKPGQLILDTHLGSGSIAIACHNLGFDLTAAELDKDYYDPAMKRLQQHIAQQRLF